jgi:hypothetical protein
VVWLYTSRAKHMLMHFTLAYATAGNGIVTICSTSKTQKPEGGKDYHISKTLPPSNLSLIIPLNLSPP